MKISEVTSAVDYYPKSILTDVDPNLSIQEYERQALRTAVIYAQKHCQPWLSQVHRGLIYRGFQKQRGDNAYGYAFVKKVRPDRVPLNSAPALHRFLNHAINLCGKKADRSNSVFVTGSSALASDYGKLFVVFPVGNFNYTWNTQLEDWFILRGKWREIWEEGLLFGNFANQEAVWKARPNTDERIETLLCPTIAGDDGTIQEAVDSGHEIMIHCNSVLAIDLRLYRGVLGTDLPTNINPDNI